MRKFKRETEVNGEWKTEILELDKSEIQEFGYGNSCWEDDEGNVFSEGVDELYYVEDGKLYKQHTDNFYEVELPWEDGRQLTIEEVEENCQDGIMNWGFNSNNTMYINILEDMLGSVEWEEISD